MEMRRINIAEERHEGDAPGGTFILGDVREAAEALSREYEGRVKAVYMDPPFMTGRRFYARVRVGEDGWKGARPGELVLPAFSDVDSREEYLALMRCALTAAHRMLRPDGMLFLHIDYRVHPYMRLLLDEIFGESNFLNEIIWVYQTGGRTKKCFSRKHDVILFYAKSKKYDFCMDNVMMTPAEAPANHMRRHIDPDGRVYRSIRSNGKVYTYYDDEPVAPSDVWTDVSHLQQKDPERTGYDTQKPLALLARIIGCSTREGELVCDLFSGSGTTLEAAKRMGRAFIGMDASPLALSSARRRLEGAAFALKSPVQGEEGECRVSMRQGIGFYHFSLEDFAAPDMPEGAEGLRGIEGWSAGYAEGGVYRAMSQCLRTRKKPALDGEIRIPMYEGTPAVAVYDALGRSWYYSFE